jgi:hypothetical protein
MSLDGIVRMVDAFFRHWDDTEKMCAGKEHQRGAGIQPKGLGRRGEGMP